VLIVQVPLASITKAHTLVHCSSGFGVLQSSAQTSCIHNQLIPVAGTNSTAQQRQHAANGGQHIAAANAPVRISSRRISFVGAKARCTAPYHRQQLHMPCMCAVAK
jgi:hypothetical protein